MYILTKKEREPHAERNVCFRFNCQVTDRLANTPHTHAHTHTHTHTHTYTFLIFAHTHMYKRIHTRLSVFPPYANSLLKLSLSLKEIQCEGQSKGGFVGVFDSD